MTAYIRDKYEGKKWIPSGPAKLVKKKERERERGRERGRERKRMGG
jgi:hypothetical protein